MSRAWISFICFASAVLVSCTPGRPREPVLGQAFVGAASVKLRKEITPKSDEAATVHFGEKLEIIGTKRRFVRVRTRSGVEGWLEDNMLLGQSDMDQIKAQSDAARKYPSQGIATTFDTMNVHAQPNRFSPSYIQVKEGEKFDVLEHRLMTVPASAIRKPVIPSSKAAKKTKREKKPKIPLPPTPAAPGLPSDWMDLSKQGEAAGSPKDEDPPPTTPQEDWSLVRTASGQSGWVLSRRLYMAIPDEVAQYAEGRRITSYFRLGQVHDGENVKAVWLWTTINAANQPYDYDSFRVFIWNLRRHRYETALIQRHLRGYFPTIVNASTGRFGVCVEKEDGQRSRREYRLVENLVKFAGEGACTGDSSAQSTNDSNSPQNHSRSESELDKLKGKLKGIIK